MPLKACCEVFFMEEYAPGILGDVSFSPHERGYYVVLYNENRKEVGRTGFFFSEEKAKAAGQRLAKSLGDTSA